MLVCISAFTLLVHLSKGLLKEIRKVTVQEQPFLASLGQEAQGALCYSLDTARKCHKPVVVRDGCTGPEDSCPGAWDGEYLAMGLARPGPRLPCASGRTPCTHPLPWEAPLSHFLLMCTCAQTCTYLCVFVLFFETGSHYVAQAVLELNM